MTILKDASSGPNVESMKIEAGYVSRENEQTRAALTELKSSRLFHATILKDTGDFFKDNFYKNLKLFQDYVNKTEGSVDLSGNFLDAITPYVEVDLAQLYLDKAKIHSRFAGECLSEIYNLKVMLEDTISKYPQYLPNGRNQRL